MFLRDDDLMPFGAFCLLLEVVKVRRLNELRPPFSGTLASNPTVKSQTKKYRHIFVSTMGLIFSASLMSGAAKAQASAQATSAMVSPNNSATDGNIEPRKPSITDENAEDSITVDPSSLLPDLPPVPHANATLVGGTIAKLDRVRDRVVVKVFGGGDMTILYDPRTVVYRGGKEASITDLQQGDRIYLDTILDGDTVFARTIRLGGTRASGESQGVVVGYRPERNELTLRDSLSPKSVQVHLNSNTRVVQGGKQVSANVLLPGSLVSITFSAEGNGHNTAQQVSILAVPGQHFTFSGAVVHIDLRTGLVVVKSSTDNKTYDIYLGRSITPDENLHPGTTVTAVTDYDGTRYVARNLTINSQ